MKLSFAFASFKFPFYRDLNFLALLSLVEVFLAISTFGFLPKTLVVAMAEAVVAAAAALISIITELYESSP